MKKRRPEDRLNHWVSHRMALVSPNVPVAISPKVTELEVAEGQCSKAMNQTKCLVLSFIFSETTANTILSSCFLLAREKSFKTKTTELIVCGYWVVVGSARESES
ncbi:hypothetical protein H5410_046489 [Solanum commersonii]|uniref:Uncharacterized protein n=1 Tax=Solanum commersonii TaxID=4109 RepID=A0A9J5XEK4_SOLCO|nr:hypothetical protein H5410_046489 [Solanum commersonii]